MPGQAFPAHLETGADRLAACASARFRQAMAAAKMAASRSNQGEIRISGGSHQDHHSRRAWAEDLQHVNLAPPNSLNGDYGVRTESGRIVILRM